PRPLGLPRGNERPRPGTRIELSQVSPGRRNDPGPFAGVVGTKVGGEADFTALSPGADSIRDSWRPLTNLSVCASARTSCPSRLPIQTTRGFRAHSPMA